MDGPWGWMDGWMDEGLSEMGVDGERERMSSGGRHGMVPRRVRPRALGIPFPPCLGLLTGWRGEGELRLISDFIPSIRSGKEGGRVPSFFPSWILRNRLIYCPPLAVDPVLLSCFSLLLSSFCTKCSSFFLFRASK